MRTVRGAIVDVDGTIVRGSRLLSGARDGLDALRAAGVDVLLFSNNPTASPDDYRDRLATHGVSIDPGRVLTAGVVTAEWLAEKHPDAALFVVGSPGLCSQLRQRDLRIVEDPDRATVVVGSYDRSFDYDRLTESLWALEAAETFVGTDPDRTIPAEKRPVPGSGAIVRAMAGVAERDPDRVLGKPSTVAGRAALERLGTDPAETLVIGDRLDTDVALGERLGATAALVLTGVCSRADLDGADNRPGFVLDSLADVGIVLDRESS